MKKIILFITLFTAANGCWAMEQGIIDKVEKALDTEAKKRTAAQMYAKGFSLGRYKITRKEYETWKTAQGTPSKNDKGKEKEDKNTFQNALKPVVAAATSVGGALQNDPAAEAKKELIVKAVRDGIEASM